jgi:hypothetical protein
MKWGTAYGRHYVQRLWSMVKRHSSRPVRFVCFTDDPAGLDAPIETRPLPQVRIPDLADMPHDSPVKRNAWQKVGLYKRELADLSGPVLYLDLDVVITGSLEPLYDFPGKFCIIENWTQRGRGIGNSSVVKFTVGEQGHIVDDMENEPRRIASSYYGEQHFVSRHADGLTFWPAQWCRSFKVHCMPPRPLEWALTPRLPRDARVIVFHGSPKPDEAIAGRFPKRGRFVRPTPWVAQHWR